MPAATTPLSNQIKLTASDGYQLGATLFETPESLQGTIVLAGATGVPQEFYRRFALYAASLGFNVLTFDYRGIGRSKQGDLKGFQASYFDWAQLDAAAAVDFFATTELPLYFVGHSFGGHVLGLLPNHERIRAAYVFGSGAGWAGWMPKMEALKVRFMWKVVLPIIVRQKGYMASGLVGMGEDLPLGVYQNWKRWCSYPNYFFGDEHLGHLEQQFAAVKLPLVAANSTDDLWAPPRSRNVFFSFYSGCELMLKDIEPNADATIGHMGYFRASAQTLWHETITWLLKH